LCHVGVASAPSIVNLNGVIVEPSKSPKFIEKGSNASLSRLIAWRVSCKQNPNSRRVWLLRPRHNWPRSRAPNSGDEVAPPHGPPRADSSSVPRGSLSFEDGQ